MSANRLPWHSIKVRVTLSTLAIFVFSFLGLSYYATRMLEADMERMLGEQQFSTATLVAQQIDAELTGRIRALEIAAAEYGRPFMGTPAELQMRLQQRLVLKSKFNAGVWASGRDGTLIASSLPSRMGGSYAQAAYTVSSLMGDKPIFSRPIAGVAVDAPLFAIAVPIRDVHGKVMGVLTGVIDLGKPNFLHQLANSVYGKHGGYVLFSPKDRLILTATDKSRIMRTLPSPGECQLIDRYVEGYEGYGISLNSLGTSELSASKGIPVAGWVVSVVTPTADAFAPIHDMQQRMWWFTIALSILAATLTWLILRWNFSPLLATVKALARVPQSEQLPLKLPNPSHDEIGDLIAGFNHLLLILNEREIKTADSELRWKFAVEGAGDGMWDWDIPAGVAFFSPRYKEMLGYAEADIGTASNEWSKRVHPEDAPSVFAALKPYMEGKDGVVSLEFRMLRKDGRWQWTLGRGMVVSRDAKGHAVRMIGTNSDITERKAAEACVQRALADAEAANASKSRFLAAASHDLRQPMAALSLYTSMLGSAVKPGQDKLVSHMQSCVDNLSGLLNDLFDLSKLDSDALVPKIADFSFDRLCNSLQTIYQSKAEKKGLRLRCRHGVGLILRTDQRMLHRLIGNVIDNAVTYTAHGGVLVATRRHSGKLWLEVWDTGVGMAQHELPHIFEEFRQLGDNARNRGSGLGLAIVSKMAALLGLEVRVESRPGRGTVFSISLPEGGMVVSRPDEMQTSQPGLTIGLVEDNALVLNALVLALQGLGHTLIGASSGAQLLAEMGEQRPDLVVCDYRLAAGETGMDVIASARARFGPLLPAIILTGDTAPDVLSTLASCGIPVYNKPIALIALDGYIRQAVKGK